MEQMKNPYLRVEKDLNYYFNHSCAAIGYGSNFSSIISGIWGVRVVLANPDTMTDKTIKQIKKNRLIRQIFYKLDLQSRRMLESCYNFEVKFNYPPEIINVFGEKAGIAMFSKNISSLDQLTKLCRKKSQGKMNMIEMALMKKIKAETDAMWEKVHLRYIEFKHIVETETMQTSNNKNKSIVA